MAHCSSPDGTHLLHRPSAHWTGGHYHHHPLYLE